MNGLALGESSHNGCSTARPVKNHSRPKDDGRGKIRGLHGVLLFRLAQFKERMPVPNMDVWSWVLLVIGVFVAVSALVRLMRRRRDQLLGELTAQAREEQHRKQLAELQEKRKQKKRAA